MRTMTRTTVRSRACEQCFAELASFRGAVARCPCSHRREKRIRA